MKSKKQFWFTAALVNLCIVASLGVTLRSKILFPLRAIDFKYVLHAHSHFAFGGWVTLSLLSLMVYEILPDQLSGKRYYQWFLWGILLNAVGMLISFLCQGYSFFSIVFSTLFIFVTYAFSYVFIKDMIKAKTGKLVSILIIAALSCLVISSIGPFTLAYVLASHSSDSLLYQDSIYTYLHLQYNGFFTLSVFAVFFNAFYKNFDSKQLRLSEQFASVLSISIIPSLFISYLWHPVNWGTKTIAVMGCFFIVLVIVYLILTLHAIKDHFHEIPSFIRIIGLLSIIAFFIKSLLQTGTIIPSLGKLVYGDRAVIIGYLHLVLLGFITLYILAHQLYIRTLQPSLKLTRIAIATFAGGVIANELILMVQGFGNMFMISNSLYAFLLWIASIWLFCGALLILVSRLKC